MSKKRIEKKPILPRYSLSSLIIVLALVALAFLFGRILGPAVPSSSNEINNITSILEVLVAVLAIIGFELFLQTQEAMRRIERFDDRIDKLEDCCVFIQKSGIDEIDYLVKQAMWRQEDAVSEALQLQFIANVYLQVSTDLQRDHRYQDGMSLVFSEASEVTAYASRLFKVYFDDMNYKIDPDKYDKVLTTIEYIEGTLTENNADTYKMLLDLRLNLARERIKRWSEIKGRITAKTSISRLQTGEEDSSIIVKRVRHLRDKIDLEENIIKRLYRTITEIEKIGTSDHI